MTRDKTQRPTKRSHTSMVRFNDHEFEKVSNDADAVRQDLAVYLRELATGTSIRVPRSLPASDRKLLATAMSMLGEVISRLDRIVSELEVGDVPLESEVLVAIQQTTSALEIFEAITERFRTAADAILSELGRA